MTTILKKVNEFNEKFKNKKVLSCDSLDNKVLVIESNTALLCCLSTTNKSPIITDKVDSIIELDKDSYIESFIDNFYEIQKKQQCSGNCKLLTEREFVEINYDDFVLGGFNYGTYFSCDVKCVYCSRKNLNINPETELKMLKSIMNSNMIGSYTLIGHAYGEPTINPNFDYFLNALSEKNAKNVIMSSGQHFSENLFKSLKKGETALNISVDSGTPETYKKIKGIDGFEKVWRNIEKYVKSNGVVEIKYIVFSFNSNKKDLDGFVKKCIDAKIKKVVISAEINTSLYQNKISEWSFGEYEIDACIYLLQECLKKNISVSMNFCVADKDLEDRLNKKKDKVYLDYYKNPLADNHDENEKHCIFGAGSSGKILFETLKRLNIKVDYFCDNKHNFIKVCDIPCISVDKAVEIENIKIIIPNSLYSLEMKIQLDKMGFSNYIISL